MTAEDTIERYATARYVVKEAHEARWARRIAVFFLQLLILTAVLHRFFGLNTGATINLVGVSMVGLALAVLIAVVSLIRIWFGGYKQACAVNTLKSLITNMITGVTEVSPSFLPSPVSYGVLSVGACFLFSLVFINNYTVV